jgi:predicted amidohydrolase
VRIGAAQMASVAGNVAANIAKHLALIDLAVTHRAGLLYFPELSLTGYVPRSARSLACDAADRRLDVIQQRSDTKDLVIGLGLPLGIGPRVQIGMVWFTPGAPRRTYAKQRLHADEQPYFVPGDGQLLLTCAGRKLAPAICYESLCMDHADAAASLGAEVYLTSVAKPAGNVVKAMGHYPAVAREHSMFVTMANATGISEGFYSAGRSAAWNAHGELLAQLDTSSEGVVLLDTTSETASVHKLECGDEASA